MELISERLIVILTIMLVMLIIALALLISVVKLIKNTKKDVLAKFRFETKFKDISSSTELEVKALDKKEKK